MLGIFCGILFGSGGFALYIVLLLLASAAFLFGRRAVSLLFAALSLGMLLVSASTPPKLIEGRYIISARVCEAPKEKDGKQILLLSDLLMGGESLAGKLRLVLEDGGPLSCGDIISADAYIEPVEMSAGFGYHSTLLGSGIYYTGSASKIEIAGHKTDLYSVAVDIRLAISKRLGLLFEGNAPLAEGLLLGVTDNISEEDMLNYRDSGITHILALSGFNIAIIIAFMRLLLKRTAPAVRLIVTSLVIIAYGFITAFPASLVRAGIMGVVLLFADTIDRRYDALSSLMFSASAILAVMPFQVFAPGFLLSFSATLTIILLYPVFRPRLRLFPPLADTLCVSATASFGTLPFSLMFFHRFPLLGLLANIVIVPLIPLVMAVSALALLLSTVSPVLAMPFAAAGDFLLSVTSGGAKAFAQISFATLQFYSSGIFFGVMTLVGAFMLSGYVLRPVKDKIIFAGICFVAGLASCFF